MKNPLEVTQKNLDAGKELYTIFCAVCHGDKGDGNGILMHNNLGASNVRFIGGLNLVGVVSESSYTQQTADLDKNIAKTKLQISEELNANK